MNVLYNRFVSFKLHLSKSVLHCWNLYLMFRCCKPVQQYDSKTVSQRIIETMLLPICMERHPLLSASIHHRLCKPLVRCVCKQAMKSLPKIAFSYWCKANFGYDWYILASNWHYGLYFREVKIRFTFPAFSKKVQTCTLVLFLFFFWAAWASENDAFGLE